MLLDRGHNIRGLVSDNPEIRRWAAKRNVRVIDPGDDFRAACGESPFDYLFSVANLRLLPKDLVALPRVGMINFHDGPLPRYAGIHTTSWALMNGERVHGVTWHFVNDVVDGGKILKQRLFEVAEDETALSLNTKCLNAGMETFQELLSELSHGAHQPKKQDLSQRTYFGRWQRPDAAGIISWRRPAEEIGALVQALELGPYPNSIGRAKIAVGDEYLVCAQAEVLKHVGTAAPGTLTSIDASEMRVASADGELVLKKLLTLWGQELSTTESAERYGLRAEIKLPEPVPLQREQITRLNDEVCRYESFWVKRLSSLQPASLPYLETAHGVDKAKASESVVAVPHEVLESIESSWPGHTTAEVIASAFSLYLACLAGQDRLDLGLYWPGLSETGGVLGGVIQVMLGV